MQYGSPQGPAQYAMMPQSPAPRKTKKRLAVVAAVSAACLASAGVYATTLAVTANHDAAGTATLATCDDTVTTQTGTPVWDTTTMTYVIKTITVNDIAIGCNNETVYVQPLTTGDAAIGNGGSELYLKGAQSTNFSAVVTLTEANWVPASDLKKVAVAIHGTSPVAPE